MELAADFLEVDGRGWDSEFVYDANKYSRGQEAGSSVPPADDVIARLAKTQLNEFGEEEAKRMRAQLRRLGQAVRHCLYLTFHLCLFAAFS